VHVNDVGVTRKALMSWSTGKDSAFALASLATAATTATAAEKVEVVGLLTTVTASYDRVSMHGVRRALLEAQAAALGLPLVPVEIPAPCPNAVYEQAVGTALARARDQGVTAVVFGDLFLADLRRYREERLAEAGMTGVFPLWMRDTRALARDMLGAGVRAHLTCVDPRRLPLRFAGRAFDEALLGDLPAGVDPCGENGEFHTFCSFAPGFANEIPVRVGDVVERDGFVFADLLPA
jgi:uncharacterized protein (TIGR00290 family)